MRNAVLIPVPRTALYANLKPVPDPDAALPPSSMPVSVIVRVSATSTSTAVKYGGLPRTVL
jgi:hypothetical protein